MRIVLPAASIDRPCPHPVETERLGSGVHSGEHAPATHEDARQPRWVPIFRFSLKVPPRTYERPALRKALAAFPADTKVS